MEEIWKDIESLDNLYQASNLGRIRKKDKKGDYKICRLTLNKKGYLHISIRKKDNKIKTYRVHRLIAKTFIPNPLNLPEINHKNESKIDNRISNLEWCNHKYNINYGNGIKLHSKKNKKNEFDLINEAI